ncbi:MAG: helix-turn-helix domain-containing protein [Microcystis sp. LE19-12.2C]|nr:helix-turn-helix domain-containing protein [Microcystis sp. LE19-12.2C]
MTQNKIEGKFYALKPEEWLEVTKELRYAEVRVLYYLRTIDPFGGRDLRVKVTDVATATGLQKGTVSKALKVLSDKGYIDLEITEALVKLQTFPKGDGVSRDGEEFPVGNTVSSDAEKFPTGNTVSCDAREFPTVPSGFLQETPSHCGKHPRTVGNDQVPEPSQEKESSTSKIIKTYSDFKKTLSEDERERFFYFVRKETGKLPNPIIDIEAWLAGKNGAGLNRWEVYYELFEKSEGRTNGQKTGKEQKPRKLSFSERNETKRLARLAGEKWIDPWGLESDV